MAMKERMELREQNNPEIFDLIMYVLTGPTFSYYLRQGGYVFTLFVCLFVSRITQKQLSRFSQNSVKLSLLKCLFIIIIIIIIIFFSPSVVKIPRVKSYRKIKN